MKVLVIASWYPSKMSKLFGNFVFKEVQAINRCGVEAAVLYSNTFSLHRVKVEKKIAMGMSVTEKNGFSEYIFYILKTQIKKIDRFLQLMGGKVIFRKYVKKHGLPDLIHLHVYDAGKIALWIKKKYGIPYIVTEHFTGFKRGLVKGKELLFAKSIYSSSIRNIAVSNSFKTLLEEYSGEEFISIPNSINTDRFIKKTDTHAHFKFITIGFLDPKKNFTLLIEAMHVLKNKGIFAELMIIGDGPEYDTIKEQIDDLDLNDRVTLFGSATHEEIITQLSESDCFLSSSLVETFGIVVIEAMASGLPSVVTRSGGPEEIITKDFLGRVSTFDVEDYANDMLEVMNNKWDADIIRQYAVDNYSDDVVTIKKIELYKEVLGEK